MNLLKKFSLGKQNTDLVGLDIGYRMVKIARFPKAASAPSFLGLFERDPNSPLVSQLKTYVGKHGLHGLPAATCVEDDSLKIRKLELPKMPTADLKEAVRWKMRDVIEGPIDDYVVRYSLLDPESNKNPKRVTLVGYAVRKKAILNLQKTIQEAGLDPVFLEPTSVSLASNIEALHPSQEWVAAIDLGVHKTLMVIMGHGLFYFSRPLQGIHLENRTDESIFNKNLAAEIQNTLDTFAVTFHVEKLAHLWIAGGGALLPELPAYLSTNLGIATSVFNPLEAWPDAIKQLAQPNDAPLFAQALSLARISEHG